MSLYALPAIGAAISAFTYKHIWQDTRSVPFILSSCKQTVTYIGFSQSTLDSLAKEVICIRTSYLRNLFSDRSGVGALMVFGSVLVPLFIKLSYHAGSPNNTSLLQGPLLPSLALALTSLDVLVLGRGFALFLPFLISVLYVIGANGQKATHSLPRVPSPARAIYGANLTALVMTIFLIATMLYDVKSVEYGFWWEQYVAPQIVSVFKPTREVLGDAIPLLALPLLWLGYRDVSRITSEAEAKTQLGDLLAAEVAYGFERTWAYYRQVGLLSFMSYIWGLSRIYRGVISDGKTPSLEAQYVLLVTASLLITFLTAIVADAQITSERDDKDALKAIARAPAGNPGVEDNVNVLLPLALFAGPSMSIMLWLAHIEEIRGYKGRRAWRANSAESKDEK